MKRFFCNHCGEPLYFENTRCLGCGHTVGFAPERGELLAFAADADGLWMLPGEPDGPRWRSCRNYMVEDVCNWMVPAESDQVYCPSCRLNEVIPDLSVPGNRFLWARMESAKRRLLFSLLRLGLPVVSKQEDPVRGLAFRFLADPDDPFDFALPVLTGHHQGVITINIAEGDDAIREKRRLDLREVYRTVLGHFRHEIGHYYWERFFPDTGNFTGFRTLFGDERQDYAESLRQHYQSGAPIDWEERFITSYAAAHPWEDWAETWAHYLHITDTLETALAHGLLHERASLSGEAGDPYSWAMDDLSQSWLSLRAILNDLNRSMGLNDPYPFVMTPGVLKKLSFIHRLLREKPWLSTGQS